MSALKDHSISKLHKQACVESEIQKRKERVRNMLQSQWKLPYPNPLLSCKASIKWKKARKKAWSSYLKLLNLIALKGRPFTNFSKLVEVERLLNVKFLEKYENRVARQDFSSTTGDCFFSQFVKSKLECTNFITIINNRKTDATTFEQDVLLTDTLTNPT